jgi:hypothetical protein
MRGIVCVAVVALVACASKHASETQGSAAPAPRPNDAQVAAVVDAATPADAAIDAVPTITGLHELPVIKGNTDNLFGSELALSSTELFIGESLAGRGRVHLYTWDDDEWKHTALRAAKTSNFGADVSLDEDTLAVSAIEDSQRGKSAGAVFVFERKGLEWKQAAKLVPPKANYQFGWQIALSGNTLVVGAPWDASSNAHRGSVFVYERSGESWKLAATLTAPVRGPKDLFGYDVAVRGDRIAVGTLGAKGAPNDSGAAYVFQRNAAGDWTLAATLASDDRSARDSFGNDVALVEDAVIVSAPAHVGGMLRGAIYVFRSEADGYRQTQKVQPDESQALDYFGDSLSALGNHVAVTAYGSGMAWLYEYANGTLREVTHVDGGRGFGSTVVLGPGYVAATTDGKTHGVRTFLIERK